jgi:hypothetical protein
VTATFDRIIHIKEKITTSTRFLSVLDGAMLLGRPEEQYVYNVTDERLIYSDLTSANIYWFDGRYIIASILVGNHSLAILTQNGYLTTISLRTSQAVVNELSISRPSYMSYSAAHNIIYVTSENSGTFYTRDFGRNWIFLFTSPLNTSKDIAAVRSSTVASSAFAASANGPLTAYWLIEQLSKDQWFISVLMF